jgi:teichoic acid transport system permease protein
VAGTVVDTKDSAGDDEYAGDYHVYEPYKAGLPPHVGSYFRELWRRREFLREMATSTARAAQQDTWVGRLWSILDPLLMAVIYFLLVLILARGATIPNFFVYLVGGLFFFEILQNATKYGSKAVASSGKMVTNTAFPKLLLPLAAIRTTFSEFMPAIGVLILLALATGVRPHWSWIACIPLILIMFIFSTGMAFLLATSQVYFRDTKQFLPYVMRLWFFSCPVLWSVSQLPERFDWIRIVNPVFDLVASFSAAFVYGSWPAGQAWIVSSIWAFAVFFIGLYVFLTRERDFAVRI